MIEVIIWLIVVGFLLYCVNAWLPMDARVKTVLNFVVIIALLLWILSTFGLLGGAHLPHPRN